MRGCTIDLFSNSCFFKEFNDEPTHRKLSEKNNNKNNNIVRKINVK